MSIQAAMILAPLSVMQVGVVEAAVSTKVSERVIESSASMVCTEMVYAHVFVCTCWYQLNRDSFHSGFRGAAGIPPSSVEASE